MTSFTSHRQQHKASPVQSTGAKIVIPETRNTEAPGHASSSIEHGRELWRPGAAVATAQSAASWNPGTHAELCGFPWYRPAQLAGQNQQQPPHPLSSATAAAPHGSSGPFPSSASTAASGSSAALAGNSDSPIPELYRSPTSTPRSLCPSRRSKVPGGGHVPWTAEQEEYVMRLYKRYERCPKKSRKVGTENEILCQTSIYVPHMSTSDTRYIYVLCCLLLFVTWLMASGCADP